jgi:hypothetical protein
MALRYVPEHDADQIELIRSFQPSGSRSVVSLWDAGENRRLPMLRWGDSIFAPVYEGMRFGLEIFNGRETMVAVPIYVEGANLWVGGSSEPEDCDPDHMWELNPGKSLKIDALMNSAAQRGRPIVITQTGLGSTVGEATFGTDAFRGQLRIFERLPINPPPPPKRVEEGVFRSEAYYASAPLTEMRRAASPSPASGASSPAAAAPAQMDYLEMEPAQVRSIPIADAPAAAPPPAAAGAPPAPGAPLPAASRPAAHMPAPPMAAPAAPRSPSPAARPAAPSPAPKRGQAGFGAAEEEERRHQFTGVNYHRETRPLLFLRTEFREDLEAMLRGHIGFPPSWLWPDVWKDDWTSSPWTWPAAPLAPHIPVTPPRSR